MENSSMSIVKADWVYRLSSILKIWKKEWAVVYINGTMSLFKSKNKFMSDKNIDLPTECRTILSQEQCSSAPPDEKEKECLFGFSSAETTFWFAADSVDDAVVWKMVIDQFKGAIPSPLITRPASTPIYVERPRNNSQIPYYYQTVNQPAPVFQGSSGGYVLPQNVVQHPDGTQTIYVNQGGVPYCQEHRCASHCCHRHHYDGAGLGLGLAAGALMFNPFMWGPYCWM